MTEMGNPTLIYEAFFEQGIFREKTDGSAFRLRL